MKKNYFSALALLILCYSTQAQTIQPNSVSSAISGAPVTSAPLQTSNGKPGHHNTTNSVFLNYGWSSRTALPVGRWATGPVFSKNCINSTDTGYIYLIGGADASFANSNLNTVYNTVTGTFVNRAPLPLTRTQVTPVRIGSRIYMIGGYGGSFSPVNTNQIYDMAADTWTTGAVMPAAVGDYAASVYKDSLIYYIGGYSGSSDVNTVQIYDTYLDSWTSGTVKPGDAVAGSRMGIAGNKIVLVGGYSQLLAATQSSAYIGVINPVTPATITWSALPAYPDGPSGRLAGGVTFEANGKVYFGGGDPDGGGTTVMNAVNAYNTVSDQWEQGPVMPTGVSNIVSLAGVVHNDSLYLVTMGGYNGTSVSTTNAWLNLGPAAPQPTVQSYVAICAGNSATLTASNALSYSWSPATALNSTSVATPVSSPASTSIYTVTMHKAYGCDVILPVTVSVNPLPVIGVTTSTTQLCAGSTATLSGTGADTYTWTGGITDNTSFSPATTDTYTVTGTDLNGCTNTALQTLTVYALPSVSASVTNPMVCAGQTVTFNGSGATSYTWSGGVTDNAVFTPASTNEYTVTGTDANGCINTAVKSVTVNALPTVSANVTQSIVCAGETIIFNGSGATIYAWTNGVADNVSYTPTATGDYTVTGTDANGCTNTAIKSVTVNALPAVVANVSPSVVCAGETVIFNGSGAVTYTWTSGVTDNSAFTPGATDSYTVTGTDTNGCNNISVTSVTVNALPVVTANATQSVVCAGSTVVLNGSGAVTFTWTGNVTDNIAFTPATTDSYTVTGTDANGCSNSASQTVSVNALPVVSANSTQSVVCAGATVVLNGSGATTYTWTGGITDNTAFVPGNTGSYTVTGTDLNGCSNTAVQSLTVNALPVVTAISTLAGICEGQSVTMNGGGAVTYTWTGNVIDNTAFSPTASASYTVTGTDANGCTNTASLSLVVNALPVITVANGPASLCKGELLSLTATGALTYTWNGNISGTTFTDSPVATTEYTIMGTDLNGCINTSTITQLVSECTSIKEQKGTSAGIRVYPNPNNGIFSLDLVSSSENTKVEIYNAIGQLVAAKKADVSTITFDLSDVVSGVYILRVTEHNKVIAQQKLIKN